MTISPGQLLGLHDGLDQAGAGFRTITERIPRLMVELFCDCCVMYLTSDDGCWLQATAVHDTDPWNTRELQGILALRPTQPGVGLVGTVVETGVPYVRTVTDTGSGLRRDIAREFCGLLDRIQVHSLVVVPLVSRLYGAIGAIVLIRHDRAKPGYTHADIPLLRDAAALTATQIESQRTFRRLTHANSLVARLTESQHLLNDFVESSLDALVAKTLEGRITLWNRAAEQLYGHARADVLGQPIDVIVPQDRRAEIEHIIGAALRGEPVRDFETVRLTRSGETIEVSLTTTAIRNDHDEVVGVAVISRDIRDRIAADQHRQQLAEDLCTALRTRDAFLQTASHELRTPLSALQLQTQALRRLHERGYLVAAGGFDPKRLSDKLDAMQRQIDAFTALVERLLDTSRMDKDDLELELELFDLVGLVEVVLERYAAAAHQAGVNLCFEAPSPVYVQGDAQRLDQAISNLVGNAIKYGEGRPVEVRVRPGPGAARIVVKDRGIGIEPHQLERIFERLVRAVDHRTHDGMGLGLWIAQRVITAHHGRIDVDSVPGQGATFSVNIPLRQAGTGATELWEQTPA